MSHPALGRVNLAVVRKAFCPVLVVPVHLGSLDTITVAAECGGRLYVDG
jgi:hypothetical protein